MTLQEIQLDFDLMQVVNSPTRVAGSSSSTIDLILLSSVNYLDSCDVRSPIGLSDHASVHLTLTLPSKKKHPRPPTKSVWIYKSANLPLAKELLSNLPVASPTDDIDEFWRSWQRSFLTITRNCVPRRSVPVWSNTPWINKDIRNDIARRERYYERYKSSHSHDVLLKFKSLRNMIVSKIRTAKKEFFENLASSINDTKKFWSTI